MTSEWMPIESAPRDGVWFLAYWRVETEEDRIRVTHWDDWASDGDGAFVDADNYIDWKQPTHWMALPTPPVVEQSHD